MTDPWDWCIYIHLYRFYIFLYTVVDFYDKCRYIIYHTWILWVKKTSEITPAWRCRRWSCFSASQMIHLLLLSIKCKIEKLWIVFVSWFGLHPPFLWQFSVLKKKVWGFMETAKLHGPHLPLRSSRFFQSLLLCFQGISIDCSKGIPWNGAQHKNKT